MVLEKQTNLLKLISLFVFIVIFFGILSYGVYNLLSLDDSLYDDNNKYTDDTLTETTTHYDSNNTIISMVKGIIGFLSRIKTAIIYISIATILLLGIVSKKYGVLEDIKGYFRRY